MAFKCFLMYLIIVCFIHILLSSLSFMFLRVFTFTLLIYLLLSGSPVGAPHFLWLG